ncbi:MAG: lipopolysaccharide kinase InaA family protein [Verrucomicrobiota bacterium]
MPSQGFSRIATICWRLCTGLGVPECWQRIGRVNWRMHPKAGEYPELESILKEPEKNIVSRQRGLFGGKSDFVYHDRLVVKRYNVRQPTDALLDLIRPSKATFAFRKAHLLENLNLPVAAAIASGVEPRRGLVQHCYLIMQRVPGAKTYRTFFSTGGDLAHARIVGNMIGRIHGGGLRHRDLRCENLLEDDQGKFWFIDMEGIRVQLSHKPDRILRDLRSLYGNFRRCSAQPAPGVLSTFWRCYLREQPRGSRRAFAAARRVLFAPKPKKA